mmetsp:Transcript_6641/g.21490  ORF Transcript_6641/g.21490 Transcript_6641/m.21490 type:complete len:280 (-) Transcript_6641:1577-2416(-)
MPSIAASWLAGDGARADATVRASSPAELVPAAPVDRGAVAAPPILAGIAPPSCKLLPLRTTMFSSTSCDPPLDAPPLSDIMATLPPPPLTWYPPSSPPPPLGSKPSSSYPTSRMPPPRSATARPPPPLLLFQKQIIPMTNTPAPTASVASFHCRFAGSTDGAVVDGVGGNGEIVRLAVVGEGVCWVSSMSAGAPVVTSVGSSVVVSVGSSVDVSVIVSAESGVGEGVGLAMAVGRGVGKGEGIAVGCTVGSYVGCTVGEVVGEVVGAIVGGDGVSVGAN